MKPVTRVLVTSVLTSTLAASMAFAQVGVPLITVDELGNGNFNGQPLPSSLAPDPFSGIVTLAYRLPFPGVPGDVQLFEPNAPVPSPPSDLIRFDGQFNMYFFSDNLDGPPFDPADVGIPSHIAALQLVNLQEVGPEGNNGAFYNPAGGLPGDNSFGASYHFVSDVPEPTTLALAAVAGILVSRRRRRLSA